MTDPNSESASNANKNENHNSIILLNIFSSGSSACGTNRRFKVYYNHGQVVYERIKDKSKKTEKFLIELCDIIAVTAKSDRKGSVLSSNGLSSASVNDVVLSPTGSNGGGGGGRVQIHPSDSPSLNLSPSSPPFYHYNYAARWEQQMSRLGDDDATIKTFTLHYAKVTKDPNRLKMQSISFTGTEPRIVRKWIETLSSALRSLKRPKNILLFINPYGGKKNAFVVYEKYAKPLFKLANVDVSVVVSQRANQISDILFRTQLDNYEAVVCCGGDGTFSELFNGLVYKEMIRIGIDTTHPEYIPEIKLPVGVLPAGSTDTIAFCLYGTVDVTTAVLHIILGEVNGLDLASVRSESGLIRLYASILSYGYLGDVARESEKHRWMGPKRYDYSGVKKFVRNRGYHVEISYLPDEQNTEQVVDEPKEKCLRNCSRCNSKSSSLEEDSTAWKKITGKFFMVSAANISCACSKAPNGISPYCHLGDGCVDLILVRHTSFFNNLRLILTLSNPNKHVTDLPFVEHLRTRKIRFKATSANGFLQASDPSILTSSIQTLQSSPSDSATKALSSFNCDGEVLNETTLFVSGHRQLLKVFRRGVMRP